MTIRSVLFDYSGVLTTPLSVPPGELPFDVDAMFVEMVHALSTTDPHPWHELERGEIPLADFCDHVERIVPGGGAAFAADSEFNIMANLEILEDRVDFARSLAADGIGVGVVTNNVAEWEPHWRPRLPADVFGLVIDSAVVGCRKPEPAIYELALTQLGNPDPSTVLFVDDFEWNVAGAEAVGMRGLHYTSNLDLIAAIRDAVS